MRSPLPQAVLLAALLFFLSLTGCEDSFSMLPGDGSEALLTLPPSGELLAPGSSLSLTLHPLGVEVERLDYQLSGEEGQVAALETAFETFQADPFSRSLGGMDQDRPLDIFDLTIPQDLAPGVWTLTVEAWGKDSLLLKKESLLHISPEIYEINGINSYPPEVLPQGMIILESQARIPSGSDPSYRWILNDRVIAQGLFSTGAHKQVSIVPSVPGVYPLVLEMRPFAGGEAAAAPVVYRTEIYVTEKIRELPGELSPPESYSSLFHFRGDFHNYGQAPMAVGEPEVKGTLSPRPQSRSLGYHFDGESWLESQGWPLPQNNRGWAPFSLLTRLLPDENMAGTLLEAEDGAGARFTLAFLDSTRVELSYENQKENRSSVVSLGDLPSSPYWLSLTVEPSPIGLLLTWSVDGKRLKYDTWETPPVPVPGAGAVSYLGGSPRGPGFRGFLDEWGIYVSNEKGEASSHRHIYGFVQEARWGHRLLVAEGFENPHVEKEITISEKALVVDNMLLMPPGSNMTLFSSPKGIPSHRIRFSFGENNPEDEGSLLIRSSGDGQVLAAFDTQGQVSLGENFQEAGAFDFDGEITFSLNNSIESVLSWQEGGNRLEKNVIIGNNDQGEFFYEFRTSSRNESVLRLDSILVTRE